MHLLLFPNHFTKFRVLRPLLDHYLQDGFIIYLDLEFNSPLLVQEISELAKRWLIVIRDDEPEKFRLPEYLSIIHPKLRAYYVDSMSSLFFHYIPHFPTLDASRALIFLLSLIKKLSQDAEIPYFIIHTTQQHVHASRRLKPLSERLWSHVFDTTNSFRLDEAGAIQMLAITRGV